MSRILVACEESQAVTKAFRDRGHEAYSCDLEECSGGHPEWHLQQDVLEVLDRDWDLVLAFPPCTYLTSAQVRWLKDQPRLKSGKPVGRRRRALKRLAVNLFMEFTRLKIPYCIENPIGTMSSDYRKPDQIIQPWMFGHGETKATCLWLKDLPKLESTKIVSGREARIHNMPPGPDRAKLRSKTYQGVADAMADQWGGLEL